MTVADGPDPRTDLAGYLGLTDEQAAWCHKAPVGTIAATVGARLIEQDQAQADEPDDGLIPVTVRLTAEEVRAAADELATWTDTPSYRAVNKLRDACADIDLPAPWKSPLADLPDLTEEDCGYAVGVAKLDPGDPSYAAQIGRALIAAGYTPEEEA